MIQPYFAGRQQLITIHKATSGIVDVAGDGVPQDSALGPLLFFLLMNGMEVNYNTLLYADVTILANNGRDLVTLEMELAASFGEAAVVW